MDKIAFIGFGEAARAFAGAPAWRGVGSCFDLKSLDSALRPEIADAAKAAGVVATGSPREACAGAALILSVVTAHQALAAAEAAAPWLSAGTLFCDCNSVSPNTKRQAARVVEAAGGRYVDVAVMSPVLPARLDAPLLVASPHADAARETLGRCGFGRIRAVGDDVGRASTIKMVRSVMVKGMEALTAECFLAAEAAGVRDEVTASLDASWSGWDWASTADYNLDRMMLHGLRRAQEMEEVVRTLDDLGTGAAMSRGTVERQRAAGRLALSPPQGLDAKLARLLSAAAAQNERDVA